MCAITNFLRKLYYKIAISFMGLYNRQKSKPMEIVYYGKWKQRKNNYQKNSQGRQGNLWGRSGIFDLLSDHTLHL